MDDATIRTTFTRLWADNDMPLTDDDTFGPELDDTIADVLVSRSHPLPDGLIPRWAIAPAVITALLDIDYRDRPDRNRLLKAVRRHQSLLDGILRVQDYPDEPFAVDLGIDVMPCATTLTVVWLDTEPQPCWLAALLRPIFDAPHVHGRPPGDPWTHYARDVAARLRNPWIE